MKRPIFVAVVSFAVLGPMSSSVVAGTAFQAMFERVLPGMGAKAPPARQAPQQEFQEACRALSAPGRDTERTQACRLIAGKLGPETPDPARVFMLRQLRLIGHGECVDAVAKLLADKDVEVKTWACWALQSNLAPEANTAILTALRAAEDAEWRATLVAALKSRAAPESVDVLIGCLADRDDRVVAVAAAALGEISTPRAIEAITATVSQAPPKLRCRIGAACIRAAERLVERGQREQARAIYRQLNAPEQPRPVRLAAQQGLLNVAGDATATLILEMLSGNDPDSRALAAGCLAAVRDENVWKRLTADLTRLPPDAQILLLGALAARGDKSVVPLVHAAAGSENREIRIAALRALAKVGDASSVPILVRALSTEDHVGATARESLYQVFGRGVEESIVAAMKGADDDRIRERLIDVLDARNSVMAIPAIVEECRHPSSAVRIRAAAALGRLAEIADLVPVIGCLFTATGDSDRDAVEKAIVSICTRNENKADQAAPVMAMLEKVNPAEKSRLLPVIGRIGSPKTLDFLRQTAASEPPELRAAAVRALANWPRPEVADDLLRIVKTSDQEPLRVQALRGYIRTIAMPGSRSPRDMLAAFQGAMALAERDQERNLVLTRATAARDVETLRWAATYLGNPALAQAACRAIVELAHHRELVKEHLADFMPALEKVIRTAEDATLVDRARLYMQQ